MMTRTCTLFAATTLALTLAGCAESESPQADQTTPVSAAPETTTAQAAVALTTDELSSLIPAPAEAKQTRGPDRIADDGVHVHFLVDGAPDQVMDGYQSALEGQGWQITVISTSSADNERGGGGAIFTGAQSGAYSVIDGGGWAGQTFIDVCAWPTKPAKPVCDRGQR